MTDVFIIGTGPAGISASLYTIRAGLSTTVTGKGPGALGKADKIQNYYGFSDAVDAQELYENGIEGAKKLGVEVLEHEVFDIEYVFADGSPDSFNHFKIVTSGGEFTSRALILAAGTSRKAPPVKGLKKHEGTGVSYCAVCDAFFYRGKKTAVLGNGDYAVSEAVHLLPTSAQVTILTNGLELEGDTSKLYAGMDAESRDKIKIDKRKISMISGEPAVSSVVFEDGGAIDTDGVFVAVGTASSVDLAKKLGVVDENGKLMLDSDMSTAVPGFYAAGDCCGGLLQVAKAVYEGAAAGTAAIKYVRALKLKL